ncbi:MAG: hypothetical protein Q4E57_01155 [Eubacteriales bacterium]|nr:hypothetical protein [Eubacteriales bacterium]
MKNFKLYKIGLCALAVLVLTGCGVVVGGTVTTTNGGSASVTGGVASSGTAAAATTAAADASANGTSASAAGTGAASANAGAAASNAAAASEKPEEKSVEEETGIYNNGGHFVKADGKVYFRSPELKSLNTAALWGNYADIYTGPSAICEYDPKTGNVKELFKDANGYGPIALSGGYLLLQEQGANDKVSVKKMDLEGRSIESYDDVTICGASGNIVVLAVNNTESSGITLNIISDGKYIDSITSDAVLYRLVGISGKYIIYQTVTMVEDTVTSEIWSHEAGTDRSFMLGELPDFGDMEAASGRIDQFLSKDGNIYLSLGFYGGTAYNYAGAYYISADPSKSDSLKAVRARSDIQTTVKEQETETAAKTAAETAAETTAETIAAGTKADNETNTETASEADAGDAANDQITATPAFTIINGEFKMTEGIPGTAGVSDKNGALGYYDPNGSFVEVAEGYGIQDLGDNRRYRTEVTELVDGDIFILDNYEQRHESADVGWRPAFIRVSSYNRVINTKTKDYSILTECTAAEDKKKK